MGNANNLTRNFSALWPLIADCTLPQMKEEEVPALTNEDLDRLVVQACYGDTEERNEAVATSVGALLAKMKGATWGELVYSFPNEHRRRMAQILIGATSPLVESALKRHLKGKNWRRFSGTVDEICCLESAGRQTTGDSQ